MTTRLRLISARGSTIWAVLVGLAAVAALLSLVWVAIVSSRPSTVGHFPHDGAAAVPASSPVSVVFDEPLEARARELVFSLLTPPAIPSHRR